MKKSITIILKFDAHVPKIGNHLQGTLMLNLKFCQLHSNACMYNVRVYEFMGLATSSKYFE